MGDLTPAAAPALPTATLPAATLAITTLAAAEQEKDGLIAALQEAESAGRWEDMLAGASALAARFPANADLQQLRSHALMRLGRPAPGILALGRAASLRNDSARAIRAAQAALVLEPALAEAWAQLGLEYRDAAVAGAARTSLQRALRADPEDPEIASQLCHLLEYDADSTPAERRAAAAEAARRFGPPGRPLPRRNRPGPLRIGYVSGDLLNHPVGLFLRSVLPAHDPDAVRCYAYANSPRFDSTTAEIVPHLAGWRQIAGLDDAAVAHAVAQDGIDILVDLSGHTQLNRLGLFARRAAPVQATWLGYFATTGLAAMDWIICDATVLPPAHEPRYSERPMRLEGAWLAFTETQRGITELPPALFNSHVTFGSRHRMSKLNPPLLEAWAELLRQVPTARLNLRNRSFDDPPLRRAVLERLEALGVAPERVELLGYVTRPLYLASHEALDITLDPFPFGGATTTAESLWMGVPVVTLEGDSFAGRMSASLVRAAGLGDLVARDRHHYLEIAAGLAADLDRLTAVRRLCRAAVPRSLGDVAGFARRLEDAFRRMSGPSLHP